MNPRLPAASKESTRLITVLLKTLIFISNPYGRAFLAYLLAGLAGFFFSYFFGWTSYLSLFTQLKDSLQSFGGKQVMIITSVDAIYRVPACLLRLSSESLPGSSWLPRARPPRAPPGWCPRAVYPCGRLSFVSVPPVASSFLPQAACSLTGGDAP